MQESLREFGQALGHSIAVRNRSADGGIHAYHYRRSDKHEPPYAVWMETGEREAFPANNRKHTQVVEGQILYYTKQEFDETVDTIQTFLTNQCGAAWELEDVSFDVETSTIIYTWRFELNV